MALTIFLAICALVTAGAGFWLLIACVQELRAIVASRTPASLTDRMQATFLLLMFGAVAFTGLHALAALLF